MCVCVCACVCSTDWNEVNQVVELLRIEETCLFGLIVSRLDLNPNNLNKTKFTFNEIAISMVPM